MRVTRPDSDRGVAPGERDGYELLRTELRALDKRRADSIVLSLWTHRARKRALRGAIACVNEARARMDAAIIDDHRNREGHPHSVRAAYLAAQTDYDRLYHGYGWLWQSAKHLGIKRASVTAEQHKECCAIRDWLLAHASSDLAAAAQKLARAGRKRRWMR